jgi:hypothetical protein
MSCLNFRVIDSGTVHHEDVCPELGDCKIFFYRSILRNTYSYTEMYRSFRPLIGRLVCID